MPETTQDDKEQNPFTRPGFIISAAFLLAIVAAAIVLILWPESDKPTAISTPQQTSTSTSAADLRSSSF
ncbi:hypothetical protein [Crystallibacter degradans]|uniref:hypothetical protein n=1 Tax=Crystallibacter degradans TaxID=2726743 RepID=UPI0014740033|nr:hypothetical protein [Arthrobacter sp. SF27]NMR32480.1 hypothetical protein [Arthrobacter sp. SF27]